MSAETPPRLADAQVQDGAMALSHAFFDDPLQVYMLPDAHERERLSPPFFSRLIRYGQLFGEVYTTPETARAAAVWLPPGETEMTPERINRPVSWNCPTSSAMHSTASAASWTFLNRSTSATPRPHWYLAVIGVDPDIHGTGVGRGDQHVVARADAAGVPCYLETAQPKNVQFYINRGFRVKVDTVEPPEWPAAVDVSSHSVLERDGPRSLTAQTPGARGGCPSQTDGMWILRRFNVGRGVSKDAERSRCCHRGVSRSRG